MFAANVATVTSALKLKAQTPPPLPQFSQVVQATRLYDSWRHSRFGAPPPDRKPQLAALIRRFSPLTRPPAAVGRHTRPITIVCQRVQTWFRGSSRLVLSFRRGEGVVGPLSNSRTYCRNHMCHMFLLSSPPPITRSHLVRTYATPVLLL